MKTPNWRMILGAMVLMGAMWLGLDNGASAAPTEEGLHYAYDSSVGNLEVVVNGQLTAPDVVIQDLKVDGAMPTIAPSCSPLGVVTVCNAAVPTGANSLSFVAVVTEGGLSAKTHVHCVNISASNPCFDGKTVRIH